MSEPRATYFSIPDRLLDQHVIALGKTRSGKSSKLRVLVEHLLEENKPVCIIDPKGDWWGLKSSANGKTAGYPLVVFGGEHADVPINEHSGSHIAELVATGNRPCLIDLGGWTVGARTRFFIDFASTLFKLTKGKRYLVIDEVHNFCPKGRVFDADAGKMLHWANRLASEGQGKGLVLLAASQRPQKVHNDFLTSCETLIAAKVIHKADRDAIKDWIDGCADPEIGRKVIAEIASLKKPEAWVWSPEIDFGPARLTWPMFRTYDSFKAQDPGVSEIKGWATVDLDEVKAKLAGVVKEAEANDPKKLKAEIARLEKLISSASNEAPKINTAVLDEQSQQITELMHDNRALEQHRDAIAAQNAELRDAVDAARNALVTIRERAEGLLATSLPAAPPFPTITKPSAPAPSARTHDRTALPSRPAATSAPRTSRANGSASSDLSKGQRVVLTAIAQSGDADPEQLTVLTGYKRSSRDTYLQQLRSAGYVSAGWPVYATPTGMAALGDFEPLPTGSALRAHWLTELGNGGERQILERLIDAYPRGLTREQISNATEYQRSSRDTYLQKLGARKLVEKRGDQVFASERLFQ